MNIQNRVKKIDFHLLDLRYSHTRIRSDKVLAKIRNSIEAYGQLVPVVVTVEQDRFVLIDGYLRIAALKACGHDVVTAQIIPDKEPDALISLLANNRIQSLEIIEQAALIQELRHRFSYSFEKIGQRIGHDKSWVKRRLDLLESLPEEVRQGVMDGKLSAWSANRVLVPLARANMKDCLTLTKKLLVTPLSTRELLCLFDHYGKSTRKIRDRIVADPGLFIKTLQEKEQQQAARQIQDGPEGKWFKDIGIICHILDRLQKTSASMFFPTLDSQQRQRCRIWLCRAEKTIVELKQQAERES